MASVTNFYSSPRHSPQSIHTSHETAYAVSDGCYVVGTNPYSTSISKSNEVNGNALGFIRWKTSFNDEIARLVSTADGSIIAVITMAQSLSLIRGGNGDNLASRSIRPKVHEQESTLLSHCMVFAKNSDDSVVKDVLVIPYLVNERHKQSNDLNYSLNVMMVCNINGAVLNGGDKESMREALMQISKGFVSISIELPVDVEEIVSLKACFIDEKVIRFVMVDSRGCFLFYDHDAVAKNGATHQGSLSASASASASALNDGVDDEKWCFDGKLGSFEIDCSHDRGTYLLLMAKSNTGRQKICWFDFITLKLLSQYELGRAYDNATIHCIHPIQSSEHTIAVAIAVLKSNTMENTANEICIVQGGIIESSKDINDGNDNDDDNGDINLDSETTILIVHPETVFTIPIEEVDEAMKENKSDQLFGHMCRTKEDYSFTYRAEYENHVSFWKFEAAGNAAIGQIKGLFARGALDEAEKAICELSHDQLHSKYGTLHNSDIALWRFKHLLKNEKILSLETKDQVREIFRRLATGAVSGGEYGLQSLMKASETLRNWPKYAYNNCMIAGPQIRDYRMVMSAMSMNIANAVKGVSSRHTQCMKKEINLLEAKSKSLKCIQHLISSGKEEISLGCHLGNVNNIAQLFKTLVAGGLFVVAERVRKFDAGCDIGPKQIASSIVCIPTDINPYLYCNWLEELILPALVVSQENMDPIKDFVCTTADIFDEDGSFGIDGSILLLETVRKSIANGSVDKYLSFPSRLSLSVERKNNEECLPDGNILDVKLFQANLLKQARNLGLLQKQVRLGSFNEKGGVEFISKDLIRISCEFADIVSFGTSEKKAQVVKFCEGAGISFDSAVSKYAEELCDTNRKTYDLKNASNLAYLCSDPVIKCQIALKVLRSVQLSNERIESLKDFAEMAIQWAQQDEIKSELEEVTRLLVIDDVVRRYCGQKAVELFRVTDSLHSMRLLNYICRCINMPSQLEDVIFLCESFTHLSRVDACVLILERITMTAKSAIKEEIEIATKCEDIIRLLAKKDIRDAKSVALRFCLFCSEMTHQISYNVCSYDQEEIKRLFPACCSAAIVVGSAMVQQLTLTGFYQEPNCVEFQRLQSYYYDFQRLQYLFVNYSIASSLVDLRRGHKSQYYAKLIIESLLQSWTNSAEGGSDLKLLLKSARRGVSKLCGNNSIAKTQEIWCKALASVSSSLLRSKKEELCLKVLDASGILNEIREECAYHAIISTVIALCSEDSVNDSQDSSLSSMRRVLIAGSLLQEHVLMLCSKKLLPSVVFLNNATDIITQVILRTDCGVGEEMDAFKSKLQEKSQSHKPLSRLRKQFDSSKYLNGDKSNTCLHPTWYVGDGLLLPPTEAISHCMKLFQELIIQSFLMQGTNAPCIDKSSCIEGLYEFLHSRGAYSISSRMLMCTFTVNLTSAMENISISAQSQAAHEITYCLAERSLGSSGSGNTSGNVDSELAVYNLLSLPIKVAFKVYRRCLPSAISGRDFCRLLTLANVGLRAAGVKSHFEENFDENNYSWKKQLMFISQCKNLLDKAHWWKILQHFNVSFDPNGFEEVKNKENELRTTKKISSEHSSKIEAVLSDLISHASEVIEHPDRVTDLALDFVHTFHLDSNIAIQRYIQFVLSWPNNVGKSVGRNDIRRNLKGCEEMARKLLDMLPTQLVRSSVLRRCLIALEEISESGQDFERYFFILSLYRGELLAILENKTTPPHPLYFQEIKRIDRRLDALAIISSFFIGKSYGIRPLFQKCFISLTKSEEIALCGVLGKTEKEESVFDPLLPLRDCLKNKNSTSALAPLCSSLGLPSGYIHARALVEQMDDVLPSFSSQVLPVVKRLKKPKDGAKLAEWCANKYPSNSSERLNCLRLAEALAIKASNEAENSLQQSTGNTSDLLSLQERDALDTVKRITATKRVLADEVLVIDTLKQYQNQRQGSKTSILLSTIVEKVKLVQAADPTPEKLVENLLIQGSLQVAEASLDRMVGLSEDDFFTLSLAIHNACKCLEDRYSHIDMELISTTLVRRWLLHGDDTTKPSIVNKNRLSSAPNRISSITDNSMSMDEEETCNFVLDLKAITAEEDLWSENTKSENLKQKENITLDEEPSSLKEAPSGREISEFLSARVGLRVAFILFDQNETTEIKKRARYLLKVVFARTTLFVDRGLKNVSINTPSYEPMTSKNNKAGEKECFQTGKALTFAMRYRALRAVSVLCDKQMLLSIIAEDKYFNTEKCSFSQCCFGSLLAKESESMRLSLPHSDLEQLSRMHHPSYARTLWKHFRHTDCNGFKGRYLLLLFELSLREEKITDLSLLKTLLYEIMDDKLPRTMLLACECLAEKKNLELIFASDEEVGIAVLKTSKKLAALIINELNEEKDSRDVNDVVFTLNRLGKVIRTFLQSGISSGEILAFVKMLCKIGESNKNDEIVAVIFEVAASISFQLSKATRSEAFAVLKATVKGQEVLKTRIGNISSTITVPTTSRFDCFERLLQLEREHKEEIAAFAQNQ